MKKIVILILAVAVFAAGCAAGVKIYRTIQPQNREDTCIVIEERISEISELVTLEYVYTNAEKSEGEWLHFFKWDIPFTEKYLTVKYSGTMKYSVDLSKVQTSQNGNMLKVTLPHSTISSHEIDENSWEFLDIKNGAFNPVTPQDDADLRKDAKQKMEARAKELNLTAQADENAIKQVTQIVKGISPELDVEVVVG